jgi:Predicted Zn-dependent peptidases
LGLTYSIYSYGSAYKQAGLLHVYGAMNPQQLEMVVYNIFQVIEELKKDGLTGDELIMTKEQIKTELIMGNESAKNRMNSNGKSILFRDSITPLEEIIDRVNAVTEEEVIDFAKNYLVEEKCSFSLVGNLQNIEKVKFFS